jgi:phosphoribosylamine---glycine ligase
MRILIIDPQAASLDWVMRCQADGHKVKCMVKNDPKVEKVGKGVVERIDDLYEWFKWPDMVFYADNTLWLQAVDQWKSRGVPVIGPSQESVKWELDRDVGMKVLKKADIEVPPTKEFNDYDAAIAFVKKTMLRYVSKPSDSPDKALSYCAKSPADMVYMLERWKRLNKLKNPFILQEFKPGIEMAVGGWFGPGGFNRGWCENWEFKKLMNDDKGVATGEQGTVLRYVKQSSLANKVLKPVEDQLAAMGYVGYIDVNCIITDDGTPWPLEFTMRPGWPTFNIQQALHKGDHAQWLLDLAEGTDAKNWEMDTIAVGVVLSIPDYPYSHLTRKEVNGVPLYGMTPENAQHIHPCEMMMGEAPHEVDGKIVSRPCLVTAGDYVLVASGTGATVSEAKKAAYKILDQLSLPNSPMYRTDIGNRLKKQLPKLQSMGYAVGMQY